MKAITTALFLSLSVAMSAQSIKIIGAKSKSPLPGATVKVVNDQQTKGSVADVNGELKLALNDTSMYVFNYVGYEIDTFYKHELISLDYVVALTPKNNELSSIYIFEKTTRFKPISSAGVVEIEKPILTQMSAVQTTADILSASGEVYVQKSQLGGGSPMLRGFAANSVLLVLDGVRLNNAIYRSGNLQNVIMADPNSLESVDIHYGLAALQYGGDALGGAIHLQTEKVKPGLVYDSVALRLRTASANEEFTSSAQLKMSREKWGSVTTMSFSRFGNLRSGSKRSFYPNSPDFGLSKEYVKRLEGKDSIVNNVNPNVQRPTSYSQFNLLNNTNYQIDSRNKLSASFYFSSSSNIPRYDRLIQRRDGKPRYAKWEYGPQRFSMLRFAWQNNTASRISDRFDLIAAYQSTEESRISRAFGQLNERKRTESVDVLGINADVIKNLGKDLKLYYGLEGVFNSLKSRALLQNIESNAVFPAASRYPDGINELSHGSLYAIFKKEISQKSSLQAGLRGFRQGINSNIVNNSFYNLPFTRLNSQSGAFTYGITYKLEHNLFEWELSSSSAFRAPNIDDIAKVFDSEPGNVIVPNPNLEAEKLYNIESEVAYSSLEKSTVVQLGGYFAYLNDAIVRGDYSINGEDSIVYQGEMSKVRANINSSEAYVYGFNFKIKQRVYNYLSIRLKYTYLYGEDVENKERLRHANPPFGSAAIDYKKNKLKLTAESRFQQGLRLTEMNSSEQNKAHLYSNYGANPWWTLNFHLSYASSKGILLKAGVENILDEHYRPYSWGLSAPGRNFYLDLIFRM